jgi:branched-chain amino acid transport system permease protein
MADNPALAQISGINTRQVIRITWIIAGGLACMAGTMLALDVSLKPDLAFNIVLPIFAAAIVGGLGQAYGAIAGGFLVGFAETLAVFNWTAVLRPFRDLLPAGWSLPDDLALVPTDYKLTVAFVILVVVLLFRPTGIFRGAST